MTQSITSIDTSTAATTADTSLLSSSTSGNSALGKDAFLKLLVAQISNQDPLKPMDDTAFVAQLAQFSSLEQMMSVNTKLDTIATGQQSVTNSGLTTLIGKSVTVGGSTVALDGTQSSIPLNFTLSSDATTVDVNIANSDGKTIRTMSLGATKAGLANGAWDGRDDQGVMQAQGTYSVSIAAKASTGTTVNVSQETTSTLQAVTYSSTGTATLELSNGVSASASTLVRVDGQTK